MYFGKLDDVSDCNGKLGTAGSHSETGHRDLIRGMESLGPITSITDKPNQMSVANIHSHTHFDTN